MSKAEKSKVIDEVFNNLSEEDSLYRKYCLDIALKLHDILDLRDMSQKDLADLMDKKESEISRWLSGMHNFTLKTLIKLQIKLSEPIIEVKPTMFLKGKQLPDAKSATKVYSNNFKKVVLEDSNAANGSNNQAA